MSDLYFILSRLDIGGVIDILLVTLVFYWILTLIQGTQAVQLLRGVLILSVLAVIAASVFNTLTAFSWLINKALPALLVAIPVIFQPELRRALERLGRTGGLLASHRTNPGIEKSIEAVGEATVALSLARHGALIIFERDTGLEDHIETGIRLNALTTPELLTTIFFPNTILHDGGVIIREEKIVAAATVLPLSQDLSPDKSLGTRHRAALGITETTDAIAVIVSEETGIISVAHDGQLIRGLDKKRLNHLLRAFYKNQLDVTLSNRLRPSQGFLKRLRVTKSGESVIQSQTKR